MIPLIMAACCSIGCIETPGSDDHTWHTKMEWKATDYFGDPQVIALCQAIEANDIHEIDRLVDSGADVNAKGKGNMTPLLWAFPDNKLKRFTRLLEHGADPNVITDSDFGVPLAFHPGDSVTHMAARTAFPGYLKAVMEHGADPDLVDKNGKRERTLLHAVITAGVPDVKGRVRLLIDKGADLDKVDSTGTPPARAAVGWFNQYDIALLLLQAGADPTIYRPGSNSKLVHAVESRRDNVDMLTPEMQAHYHALEKWLREYREDFEQARVDVDRWKEWGKTLSPKAGRIKMEREVAERKAREKAEAEKKEAAGDHADAGGADATPDEVEKQK